MVLSKDNSLINRKEISTRCFLLPYCLVLCLLVSIVSAEAGSTLTKVLNTNSPSRRGSNDSETCLTEGCKMIAKEILRNMNTRVSPCHNFYEFACGNYKSHVNLNTGDGYYNQFMEIEKTVQDRLQDIINEPISRKDAEAVKKAKKAFKVCVDEKRINKTAMAEMKSILAQKGGWPIATSLRRDWTSVSWRELDKWYINFIGESAFFRFSVEPDTTTDPTRHVFVLIPSLSALPTNILQTSPHHLEKMDRYRKFIVSVALRFVDRTSSASNMWEDANSIVALETALAKIKHIERQAGRVIPMQQKRLTMSEFIQNQKTRQRSVQNKIDWESILQSFFANSNLMYDPTWKMVVHDVPYFENLEDVLSNVPAEVIINYIHWQLVRRLLRSIDWDLEFLDTQMRSDLLKDKADLDRREDCLNNNPALIAIVHRYLEKHVPLKTVKIIKEMVKDVKKEFEHQISGAPWLDREAKDASILKLKHLNEFVGPSSWVRNATLVSENYHKLEIGDSHIRNIFNKRMHDVRNLLNLLPEPVNRLADSSIWPFGVTEVNAYNFLRLNALIIPVGVMQPPLFFSDVPENVQFGTLGTVIGHELTHSFDEAGREYAHDGSHMTWSSKSGKEFEKRVQCWIDQFNGYRYKELEDIGQLVYCNGAATATENMADSVGMQLTYAAYKTRAKNYQKLPGLNSYTDDQLFFLSYANMWCEYRDVDMLMYLLQISQGYSIGEHRLIGTLSNIKAFADAFQCSKYSPMFSKRRCSLWN
ncbi:membrane metallo-endopeptidase-like 1 [Orussus abietinus]|uniref:membrane metallo-endopeptidase-like 1 n=1 Tax=Orussus abietinus TaxID=222816 RepID=UPI0006250944|nr:membrane metallo-endopeptidase-like 1 [Orussus abietinus]